MRFSLPEVPHPRARIDLAAVADAFAPDGPHGTPAAALARAAGVTKPTLYRHAPTKDALLLLAVQAEVERVLDALAAADRAPTARAWAHAAARALLDHAAARPGGARLLHRTAWYASGPAAAPVAAALDRVPAHLADRLARALSRDGLDPAPAPVLARALHGAAAAQSPARAAERRRTAALLAALVPEPPASPAEAWPAA